MTSYRLSPRAESDLEEIWLYTRHKWSVEQADSYYNGLVSAFDRLSSGVAKGKTVVIRPPYLKLYSGKHCIFYIVSKTGIDVIRILHQSMDFERHL